MSKQVQASPVSISVMTGKLAGFLAINFNPLTNSFCEEQSHVKGSICSFCYSRKMISTFRVSCGPRFTANSAAMCAPLEDQELPRFPVSSVARFLAHGELSTVQQLRNFYRIAQVNQATQFALWTKRVDLMRIAMFSPPKNLNVVQSSRMLGIKDEKAVGTSIVFTVYEDRLDMPDGDYVCAGQTCASCMHCYKPGVTQDVAELLRR